MSKLWERLELSAREVCAAPEDLLQATNAAIAGLRSYGAWTITAQAKGWRIIWSNGHACWNVFGIADQKGDQIYVDANMLMVYSNRRDILAMLPNLDTLPLYSNSTEGIERRIQRIQAEKEAQEKAEREAR